MTYEVDFKNVSTIGLESSPVAGALAGLRAKEARYFHDCSQSGSQASSERATVNPVEGYGVIWQRDGLCCARPSLPRKILHRWGPRIQSSRGQY
jgi:hypothetical protein